VVPTAVPLLTKRMKKLCCTDPTAKRKKGQSRFSEKGGEEMGDKGRRLPREKTLAACEVRGVTGRKTMNQAKSLPTNERAWERIMLKGQWRASKSANPKGIGRGKVGKKGDGSL